MAANPLWDEARVATELPKPGSDVLIDSVQTFRQRLMREEQEQRTDFAFRQSLSPTAKHACDIVSRIRQHEIATVWTPDIEEGLAMQTRECLFPGMMFSMARERMESTKLWKIVRKMPKGSLLHAHIDAMVEMEWVIEQMLALPGMHVMSDRPLHTVTNLESANLTFRYREQGQNGETDGPASSIWTAQYAGGLVKLTEAADMMPGLEERSGRSAFVNWLKSRCTLSPQDSHEYHHGLDAIWDKFAKCFPMVGAMLFYEPLFRKYLRRMMEEMKDDKVNWAELRIVPFLNFCRDQRDTPEPDHTYMFTVIEEEMKAFQGTPAGAGFQGFRIIWTAVRAFPTPLILENMSHCINIKKQFPELIAGYDLVGEEERGRTLQDLLPEISWFRSQCEQQGITIPFFFHAGETLGDGTTTDQNLFDAILLNTRRIGHGFSLFKHPLLIDLVKKNQILIESCPVSNEVLRLTPSILSHPMPALLARGVACSLCNDDPGILGQGTAGLSHDFWQALQGWDHLGLAGLGSLAENSVVWSAFEDQDREAWTRGVADGQAGAAEGLKGERLRLWREEWERFCGWVVAEFGGEFGATDRQVG